MLDFNPMVIPGGGSAWFSGWGLFLLCAFLFCICVVFVTDKIRKRHQRAIRQKKIYSALIECLQVLISKNEERVLLFRVCEIIAGVAGCRLALISATRNDKSGPLDLVAWSSSRLPTSSEPALVWGKENLWGSDLANSVAETGEIAHRYLVPDLAVGQRGDGNWVHSLRSVLALPLVFGGRCAGVLSIYSDERGCFDFEVTELLEKLADQIAFRIFSLRDEFLRQETGALSHLFEHVIETAVNGVMIADAKKSDYPIIYVNAEFEKLSGCARKEIIGHGSGFIFCPTQCFPLQSKSSQCSPQLWHEGRTVQRCYRKDGSMFFGEVHQASILDHSGLPTYYVSIIDDISERVQHEKQLEHLATHDPLTGFANRTLFADRLQQAIIHAERDTRMVAVLLIDLDRFKQINDSLGHRIGDILLKTMGGRMSEAVRESDTIARLGGDEFVIVLTDLAGVADALQLSQRIFEALIMPLRLEQREMVVTPSIGISLYPGDAGDTESLLKLADIAMCDVKRSGRNGFRCYSREMGRYSEISLEMELSLRHALKNGEMALYYQPKADLYTGRISGCEALLRWHSPVYGQVPPARFIPLAEDTGFILQIGEWVLREACRQGKAWQDAGLPPIRIAVNLSACQLRQERLIEIVEQALADARLAPEWLELELTESMVMQNLDLALSRLSRLKQMGVSLSLDDFGTGYSSLGYLKQFPFDTLKIDRSFVQDITTDPGDALIAVTVIAMAHSLGLRVVAEGVENESQMRYLRAHLCDQIQGYFFSKPLSLDDAMVFFGSNPALPVFSPDGVQNQRTLLLVDDEPDVLNALRRLLFRSGYRILSATTASEGLELLAMNSIQVVLADQHMLGMSGSEFLTRVKSLYPDTVRMAFSGDTRSCVLAEAVNRGAVYKFITKPWDDSDLKEQIRLAFTYYEQLAIDKRLHGMCCQTDCSVRNCSQLCTIPFEERIPQM